MSCLVDCKKTQTTFSDISVSEYLIECLRLIIFVPMNFPDAFKAGVLKRESMGGVLLYGPPGTGKTMVCRAMASQWGMRMIQIKPSDLLSAFVGQSERVAKSIFSLAHRIAPCIIFIDEIESLLHRRGQGDDRSHQRSLLNEFFQGMEGLQSSEKQGTSGVVVIGATNRPFDIDEALLRRFPARYMVGLPDVAEREKILGIHLRETKLHKEVDIKSIARQTKKYSGSDLKNLCVAAATSAVKGAAKDFQWERLTRVAASGDSSEREEVKITLDDTEITKEDFKKAMSEVPASATKGRHEEIYEWHRKHGNKGDSTQTEKGIQKFIGPLRAFARISKIRGVRLSFALTSRFPRDHPRK
ncbi:hypothetical protein GALMADRAFT_118010 [Galerina marginata CBS 339.88]|uniref:AAA+ ATPase domain-containing protein n=1 Tax=Galerina marginata (strain CBS 339.88) TaxID=685588 RepID=A0A067T8B9_GALM3|nr:hypothetical protein GALMADRAFT_118010 [Galerina marginata CBS 339.88]